MPTHFFFDLDKTLTKSRSPMDVAHRPLFRMLCESRDVAIMSGGNREQIREQSTAEFDGMYYALGQSGNHAVDKDGVELWNDVLSPSQVDATLTFIELLEQHTPDIALLDIELPGMSGIDLAKYLRQTSDFPFKKL